MVELQFRLLPDCGLRKKEMNRISTIVLLLVAAFLPTHGYSATIVSYEVRIEESLNSHGDLIVATVSLDPGEDGVYLEAQPFVAINMEFRPIVFKDNPKSVVNRRVRIDRSRGRQGPGGVVIVTQHLNVPFDDFSIAPGKYDFAYELRLIKSQKILFLQPTDVSRLVVATPTAGAVRRIYSYDRATVSDAVVGKGYGVTNGRLLEFDATYSVSKPVYGTRKREIPHDGFERGASSEVGTAVAVAPLSEFEPQQKRIVYFATNRNVVNPGIHTPARFGNDVSKSVTYGSCLVNIPIQSHRPGDLTTRKYFWQRKDPNTFFDVELINALSRDVFLEGLSHDDVLLFVHGYCNSFADSVLRSAQLQHDIHFPGLAIAMSWPSAGTLGAYKHDEEATSASIDSFADVLDGLLWQTSDDRRIHVIAHSMGNRLFLQAVRKLELDGKLKPGTKPFGSVVLAAPDVEANIFYILTPRVIAHSRRVTYYYATNDLALGASRLEHWDAPAGLKFFHLDGMDTVDATNVSGDTLNHSYYAASPRLINDLQLGMILGLPADKRLPPLRGPLLMHGFGYWAFPLSN